MSEKKSLDPPCQLLFKTLLAPNGKQCWGVTSCIDWAYFKIFTFFIFPFFFWMGIHGIRIRKELLAVCKFVHDIRPVDSEKYLLLICSRIFIWFLLFWKLFLRKISYTIHYLQAFSWKTYNTKAKNTHFVWKCLYIYNLSCDWLQLHFVFISMFPRNTRLKLLFSLVRMVRDETFYYHNFNNNIFLY